MQSIAQRIGIFVSHRKKVKGFKTRFFFIDNEYNFVYTSNLAYLEKIVKQSDTVGEILARLQKAKKLSFRRNRLGPLRLFFTIDSIPIGNKNCFEFFIENKEGGETPYIIFSLEDEVIGTLHEFIKNYSTLAPKSNLNIPNPVKKLLSAHQEEEKEYALSFKTESSHHSRDDVDIKSKFEIISKILIEKGKEASDTKTAYEDLFSKENVPVEDTQLSQLENGNSFSGKLRDGKPYGQGTEFIPDGTSYVGEFRNGKWHGTGYMVNSNLDMTYAEFMHGRPVGI